MDKTKVFDDNAKVSCNEFEAGIRRERFLLLINAIKGRRIGLTMHERTHVSGIFEAMNREGNTIAVSALDTPLGQQQSVLLRASDVISMSFELS